MKIGDLVVLRSARARKKLLEFAEKILVPTVFNFHNPFFFFAFCLNVLQVFHSAPSPNSRYYDSRTFDMFRFGFTFIQSKVVTKFDDW